MAHPTAATTMSSTTKKQEMWRSKLGTNYPKDFMEKNESRLLKELHSVLDLPENRICADCGTRGTTWASVNLGVFLCMTCGSHHRSLGTHISLPKGCTGTYIWGPDEIERMKSIGNARAKELYGAVPPKGLTNEDASRWKVYLTEKYCDKKYASTTGTGHTSPSVASSSSSVASLLQHSSPRTVKTRKFNKQAIPDIDLIHFDDEASRSTISPKAASVASNSPNKQPATTRQLPSLGKGTEKDFFAEFGL